MDDIESLTTDQLAQMKAELLDAFNKRHACADYLTTRLRTFKSGHTHFVLQCTTCGRQSGGPMSKDDAAKKLAGTLPSAFDEAVGPVHSEMRTQLLKGINSITEEIAARVNPMGMTLDAKEKLKDEKRKRLADEAIEKAVEAVRQAYPCSGILSMIVRRTQSLIEIIEEKPKTTERFSTEAELKAWLEAWIEDDFEVFKEVRGIHLTENVEVKIDYVLLPKSHLVQAGFLPGPLGLEVKYLRQEDGFSSKASRFVWQAVSYTDCQFSLPTGVTRLPRVLLFSNLSFENEYNLLKGLAPNVYENEKAKWTALLELANHANVGNLVMYGDRGNHTGWKIKFAAGKYFSRLRGECSLHNAKLFSKIRIGNF